MGSSIIAGIRLAGATSDVHIMDVRSGKWERANTQGEPPSPRAAHAAAAVGSMVVVQVRVFPSPLMLCGGLQPSSAMSLPPASSRACTGLLLYSAWAVGVRAQWLSTSHSEVMALGIGSWCREVLGRQGLHRKTFTCWTSQTLRSLDGTGGRCTHCSRTCSCACKWDQPVLSFHTLMLRPSQSSCCHYVSVPMDR